MRGRHAIREYWQQGAADAQEDVEFASQVWAVAGDTAIAGWQARFTRKASGARIELDGTFRLMFSDEQGALLCTELQEWWPPQGILRLDPMLESGAKRWVRQGTGRRNALIRSPAARAIHGGCATRARTRGRARLRGRPGPGGHRGASAPSVPPRITGHRDHLAWRRARPVHRESDRIPASIRSQAPKDGLGLIDHAGHDFRGRHLAANQAGALSGIERHRSH